MPELSTTSAPALNTTGALSGFLNTALNVGAAVYLTDRAAKTSTATATAIEQAKSAATTERAKADATAAASAQVSDLTKYALGAAVVLAVALILTRRN